VEWGGIVRWSGGSCKWCICVVLYLLVRYRVKCGYAVVREGRVRA
jgi:hypothetical protein